jgi:hypothetical protein
MQKFSDKKGLGNNNAQVCVYIENIPPLEQYQLLQGITSLKVNDIFNIGQQTGNHWRKVFNVYAKLIFEIGFCQHSSWQNFRDEQLLQSHSNESLVFSSPCFDTLSPTKIHIIMGRTYAKKINFDTQCFWLSKDFAINEEKRLIICPYFDYRQLSNVKIVQLANLIRNCKLL